MRASWLTDAHRGGVRWARLRRHVPSTCEDGEAKLTNRRTRTAGLAALVPMLALVASACGSGTPAVSLVPITGFTPDPTLLAAAQKEGTLNVIALPPDWCNYGPMITAFKGATGLAVNSINPNGGSGDEVTAVTASKGNSGPSAPDVVDVGILVRPPDGPVRVCSRPTRSAPGPRSTRRQVDPNGYWYGDYYGIMSFAVNTSVDQGRARRTGPTCSSPSTPTRSPSLVTRRSPTRPSRPCTHRPSPTADRSTMPSPASTSSRS